MARRDLTARTLERFLGLERRLRSPIDRWLIPGTVIIAIVGLHAILDDPTVAWLNAAPVLVGGLAGGARFGLVLGGLAAVGHLGLDVADGADGTHVLGLFIRSGAFLGLGVAGAVIQRLERQRDEAVLRSAMEDAVTGLLNVRAFYEGLHELRSTSTPYAILLADIAGMGYLNEKYGHPTGTEAVRTLGHVLRRSTKEGDLVARLGGDAVAVALVGADIDGARAAAERLMQLLHDQQLTLPDGDVFEVQAYFGIACDDATRDEAEVLRAADHAMTGAKLHGRGSIGVESAADETDAEPGGPTG